MAQLVFDAIDERIVESGVSKCVLFAGPPKKSTGAGGTGGVKGVAWNGITSANESPEGGDANDQFADNMKYISLRGSESVNGTVESLTYPLELEPCIGNVIHNGVVIGQQPKKPFSFCYITQVGNPEEGLDYSEKLHIIYNATCDPVEKAYETINDSPEAMTFSFAYKTVPLALTTQVNGKTLKPTAILTITKTTENATKYQKVIDALYGNSTNDSYLLMPDEVLTMMGA